jgi:hypothetical protein
MKYEIFLFALYGGPCWEPSTLASARRVQGASNIVTTDCTIAANCRKAKYTGKVL